MKMSHSKNETLEKNLTILGIRGIPAQHGGFETFAEELATYLACRDWEVYVYCQEDVNRRNINTDKWNGVNRVTIPISLNGPIGTIWFDFLSTLHAIRTKRRNTLVLGYNTALFCLLLRFAGCRVVINMDGIEWKRNKWGKIAKTWFWMNERFACWFGQILIADHPEIERHLSSRISSRKIVTIPYGAKSISSADVDILEKYSLKAGEYSLLIARPEPENSVLEIVKAFSQKKRNAKLVILGNYSTEKGGYQSKVKSAASNEVIFAGAIYEKPIVEALRYFCRFYVHGHTVGGTNPSLVEALGAGSAILANNNKFNRWVAGEGNRYFSTEEECAAQMDILFKDETVIEQMKLVSKDQYQKTFKWKDILEQYEELLLW
jgi:glycosyltransferase involved in cell wall biosynthesis